MLIEPESEPPDVQQREITQESFEEPQPSEIPYKPEIKEEISSKKEKQKRFQLFKFERKEQPPEKTLKRSHFWRKQKIGEVTELIELEKQPETITEKMKTSTFTLQIDEQGNLVGLNLKKTKLKAEKQRRFPFRRRGTEEGEQKEETPEPGVKGKIKRVFSKLRRKKSSEGEESSSGIGGKIKGIFSRKSKK